MESTADFIIVGGGTSGLQLANCLASRPSCPTVLVIEAGQDRSDLSYRNPSKRFSLAFTNPELDHGYNCVPQSGLRGRSLPYARGKGLGGSTLINFMVYLSGSKDDYNHWAELVGDDSWKWENSQRRLKELETFHSDVGPENRHLVDPSFEGHGHSGPINLGFPKRWETEAKEVIEEAIRYGWSLNGDVNSGDPIGVGMSPTTAASGYRTTSASANLNAKPANLLIWTEAVVAKVIFDGTTAKGVELINGHQEQAFAQKEVILSAGSFETPKILMLSGIGHQDELAQYGIKAIKHLPGIGKSFKDHAGIFLVAQMDPKFRAHMAFEDDLDAVWKATEQWSKDEPGKLAIKFQAIPVIFNKIPSLYETPEFKQLPISVQNYLLRDTVPTYEVAFGGPKFPPGLDVPADYEYMSFIVIGMNPQSSGTVKLASPNPEDKAIIDPQTLSHPFDRRVMIDSLMETLKFYRSTNFYKNGFVKWLTGPETETRSGIENFLEEQAISSWHANGTVKMGKKVDEENGACVDIEFRVMGIDRLRVVDMSVSPITINGHTQAAAYLIGATAAEKLIAEYNL